MPRRRTTDRSRKSSPHRTLASPGLALGVDLGATKVVSGLVAVDGRIVHHSGRQLHANDGPGGVIRSLAASVRSVLAQSAEPPVAVGVAVAAQVDPRTGKVVHAPNLGWRDVALARRVQEEIGLPVSVINDARAATAAEWRHGAGVGVSDLFCLFLGTGIGGSAVVANRLLDGGSHALGEVGHMTIVAGGRRCHCPNWGCFEAYVGGWAIAERAREAVRAEPAEGRALVERAGSEAAITAQTVFQVYRSGDVLAGRIVRETERFLADGAISVVNAFNPSRLVLGGGLISGMPEFVPAVEAAIRARCQPQAAGAEVTVAHFGEDAALVGAAEFARAKHGAGRATGR